MPRPPSLENQLRLIICLLAPCSLGFNQIVRLTGLDRNTVSRVLKYLAGKKIVARTEQGRGRRTLCSLSQGWEPYGKKVFVKYVRKMVPSSRITREIKKHSVGFGLPGQVTWEELTPPLKPSECVARLLHLQRWLHIINRWPETARISPLPYVELKPTIKKLKARVEQSWKRRGISTVDERGRNLGTPWRAQQKILRQLRKSWDV